MKVCAGHTWRHEEIVVEDKESCPLCYELDTVATLIGPGELIYVYKGV